MPSNLHTKDLIRQLKAIRKNQNLSFQQIYEMLEEENLHVSINSIKKVFADGSEDEHFRYHDTLQPISRVLLRTYGSEIGDPEIDALHAAIKVKDELIERRQAELTLCREEHARRTEFLLKQIALKDERIDRLMARVDVLLAQTQKLLDRCDNCAANLTTKQQN